MKSWSDYLFVASALLTVLGSCAIHWILGVFVLAAWGLLISIGYGLHEHNEKEKENLK